MQKYRLGLMAVNLLLRFVEHYVGPYFYHLDGVECSCFQSLINIETKVFKVLVCRYKYTA